LSTACAPEAVSEDAASRSDAPAGDLATQPPIANDSPGAPADEATADPDASDALSVDTPLTAHGWGPLRIGMTRAEVVAAAGEDANPDAVGGPDPERCDEFRPNGAPAGLLAMIENGRLSRVSIGSGSEVRTDEGIGIGDPASAVKEAYRGSATSTPHAYLAS